MTDANGPLSGVVSKAPLLVAPSFAQEKELIHYVKYKLYEEGFIVVREEFRQVNPELSEKLCVKVDYVPPYFKEEPKIGEDEAALITSPSGTVYQEVPAMAPADMDAEFRRMVAARRTALQAEGITAPVAPLMSNSTANGARQAVNLLFPQMLAMDIPTAVRAREYVQANLKTALLSALTELAKAKPANPLEWLAQRLLETNIQAPPMETV